MEVKQRGNALGHKIILTVYKILGYKFVAFILNFVSIYYVLFSQSTKKSLQSYYLKISDDNSYSLDVIEKNVALNEISKTVLAGSFEKGISETITEIVSSDENKSVDNKKSINSSKLQELQDAVKLKEQGLLTDEEFKALKSDILK